MSLKAGRVGVNPADVDPISGHISPEASGGYTKLEADEKFLSKTDAGSEYQTKRLSVPVSMLSGTKLTVEEAASSIPECWQLGGIIDNTMDLNNFDKPGVYSVTTKPTNSPVSYSILLVLEQKNNQGTRVLLEQVLFSYNEMYIRAYGGTPAEWKHWYKFTGTLT